MAPAAWLVVALLAAVQVGPRLERLVAGNIGGWWLLRGLLAGPVPNESQVESGRVALYQALDAGLSSEVFEERMMSLEVARWREQGEGLIAAGMAESGNRAQTYAEWVRVNYQRLIGEPALLARGDWLSAAQAAESLQLWSLSAYLYDRAARQLQTPGAAGCLGRARVLIELRQPGGGETEARCALTVEPANPAAHWRLAQALALQEYWTEAASVLDALALLDPDTLDTPEAAALAMKLETRLPQPLNVPAEVREAWQRQASNLVVNGSFESGVEGWAMWPEPGSQTMPDPTRARGGFQSMRAEFDGTHDVNYYQIFQTVAVRSGMAYRLTAQLWAEDFNGQLGLEVRQDDWFAGNTEQVNGSTQGWQPVSLVFEVPAGVRSISITFRHYGGAGLLAGVVWVDDVELAGAAP